MLLTYTDTVHAPVAAADVGEKVGTVTDIITEPETHTVLAFGVRPDGLFKPLMFVSPNDIVEYDPHALIVSTIDSLVPTTDIVRAHTLMTQRDHVLRRAVVTESGQKIGNVANFAFDTETAGVVRYYVHSLFGQNRIIPTTAVVAVQPKALVVADNEQARRTTRKVARPEAVKELA